MASSGCPVVCCGPTPNTAERSSTATATFARTAKTETLAHWSQDSQSVILSVAVDSDEKAKIVRIDSGNPTAHEETQLLKERQFPMPIQPEVTVPVKARYQAVRLSVMVGGSHWKPNARPSSRTERHRPGQVPRTRRPHDPVRERLLQQPVRQDR